jgi:tetratricopeptide (TPR) repeat protein
MVTVNPDFILKTAKALVDEVAQNTKPIIEKIRELREEEKKTIPTTFDLIFGGEADKLIKILKKDLELAMKLADKVSKTVPNLTLEDGTTPQSVKSDALFQLGLIYMGDKQFKEAIKYFEESLTHMPDQATYFNLGLCFLEMKGLFTDRTKDAIQAFWKCVEMDSTSELAIEAGKILARLGQL